MLMEIDTRRLRPRGPVSLLPPPGERQQQRHEPRQPAGPRRWPLLVIASPAAVAIWSGWVGLGALCGFGLVQPLPGIVPWHLDTAITLPVGVEAYGAYALGAWLSPATPRTARLFARWSALGALALGMAGQVAYHLLAAVHAGRAPWPVTVAVSCVPVVTLGFGAALTHLLRAGDCDIRDDADSDTRMDISSDTDAGTGDRQPDDSSDTAAGPPPRNPRQPKPARRDKVTDTIRRHPDWDNDKIAEHCGVSKRTVERRRTKLDKV